MAQKYIVGDVVMYDNKIMVVKEVHDILEKEMPLKGVEVFYGKAVCYRVPKSEFEKEVL